MSRILLIGGAGYVGAVLTRELLDRGFSVRVFDRLYFGKEPLNAIIDKIELVQGDMRHISKETFDDISAVINLGGLSNDPMAEYNPKANWEMNAVATEASAHLAKEAGVSRYIYASSCSIYDRGVSNEHEDIIQTEDTPVNPSAAYSSSKLAGEKKLLALADESFCPVIMRKGTIYGFSPRMRYDLVVNTFVKNVLSKGYLTIFYGGEMWRPLVAVKDAARAYIAALKAPEDTVAGEIFNVSNRNFRISEVALRVQQALQEEGIEGKIISDYSYRGVRSYRVSTKKIRTKLDWNPVLSIEDATKGMIKQILDSNFTDYDNPLYYNIQWMKLLEKAKEIIQITGSIFE